MKSIGVIRAALYARVSTTGHGQDVGLQVDELRQVAAQRGWAATEYVDDGVSGSKESRPALDKLMADARNGKIDTVVVWKLDRLGRSLQHLLILLDEFTRLNVSFVSVRDSGIDTTSPSGRLLLHLLGAFSEFEKSLIVERVQAGVDRARSKGIVLGRPRRQFDVRAVTALLDKGHGLKSIAKILGLPRTTIREHLIEAGQWPYPKGSENPSKETLSNPGRQAGSETVADNIEFRPRPGQTVLQGIRR